jgi:hypothetical protein
VSRLPVAWPGAEPGTVDEGEPGTLAKGGGASLDLCLDRTLAKGLDRSLVESLVLTLAETLAESEDEDELEVLVACKSKGLDSGVPAGLRVDVCLGIPSPGRPSWVGCTSVTSVFAVSVNIS